MIIDPIERFSQWLEQAKNTPGITEPTAMTLATSTLDGKPSARIVLLKGLDHRGFAFYSNMESRKGGEVRINPRAALCFYWMPLERQVRVEGQLEHVSAEEADTYFASRRRESQIGAWASRQSRPLAGREVLEKAVAEYTRRFEGRTVPRPPYWIGWRVVPESIEFWQQGDFRLHDREVYIRSGSVWNSRRMYP